MKEKAIPFLLFALSLTALVPFIGSAPLLDWDEINFAESSREMLVTGDFHTVQIDYRPFHEKPPFFFWMQTVGMRIWGVNETGARFPNSLIGAITIFVLFLIGKREKNVVFGLTWSLSYLGMMVAFLYFKSGLIDPSFNLFIFSSVYFLYRLFQSEEKRQANLFATLAGILCGLAILTKGPVGLLLPALSFLLFWGWNRFKSTVGILQILLFAVAVIAMSFLWFGVDLIQNGPWFLVEFIRYQIELFSQPVAGHEQPFYYHFLVVLIACFPISFFAIPIFIQSRQFSKDSFEKLMIILFWVVIILFSIAKTKIVHYSSLAYFPLSLLATHYIYNVIIVGKKFSRFIGHSIAVFGLIVGLALTFMPLLPNAILCWESSIKDPFAVAAIKSVVEWTGGETITGMIWIGFTLCFYYCFLRRKFTQSLLVLVAQMVVGLNLISAFVLPTIIQFTQGVPIANFQSIQGKDVYLKTIGYKSYAPYFYGLRMPDQPRTDDIEWLLSGAIDKPVFISAKIKEKVRLQAYPDLVLLREEGGFLWYVRKPDPDFSKK